MSAITYTVIVFISSSRSQKPRWARTSNWTQGFSNSFDHFVGAREQRRFGTLRPMPLLGRRLILEDQAEQEMHVAAVGSAFRRLGSIGSPHLAQVPYVPLDIRFRAASI